MTESRTKHVHHKIPRSRGGTDDDWNLIELDPYEHAYEHALDFVLFDSSPVFDCRHVAWASLPDDLKNAVKDKLRKIWNSRQSQKGIKGGAAARDKKAGVCSPGYGAKVSQNMRSLVDKELHWFQSQEHSQRVSLQNSSRFKSGTHPLQQPGKCPICGAVLKTKSGLGPHMRTHRNEK